jgi:hypothetical protein
MKTTYQKVKKEKSERLGLLARKDQRARTVLTAQTGKTEHGGKKEKREVLAI